jgi:hypothetical protein
MRLTKQQRQIVDDYEQLAAPLKIDVDQLPGDTTDRTFRLRAIFHEWVRSIVITRYTLIDEYLACIIANYMFGKPKTWHYGRKWQAKKFQRFNHYVLDELYLLKKQDFVHAIKPLPSGIRSKIMQVNDVRNAMAHSFFPQNRRRYYKKGGVLYDGTDIFTRPGIERFLSDSGDVLDVVHGRALPPFGPPWR